MIATALTSTMIATAAFGTVEENHLSQQFQEVIDENIPVEVVAPFNQVLEQAGLPTVPASQSIETLYQNDGKEAPNFLDTVIQIANGEMPVAPNPAPNANSFLAGVVSAVLPENSPTAPASATPTASQTNSPTPSASPTGTFSPTASLTHTATITNSPTATSTVTASPPATFVPATPIPSPTRTREPTETWTPTFTPTETPTATETPTPTETVEPSQPPPVPEGFMIYNVSLNGGSPSIVTTPGAEVTVTYDFQIYSTDSCPGCIVQLVTGLGTPGTHGGTCAVDTVIPFVYPGNIGAENTTLLAPTTPGTYDVTVVYSWEYSCSDALNNYPNGVLSQIIGQITVSP